MEAFSLLRYWRSSGGGGGVGGGNTVFVSGDGNGNGNCSANVRTSTASATTTTIVTSVSNHTSETGDDEEEDNDHGPFFDLEFSLPEEADRIGDCVRASEEGSENSVVRAQEDEDEDGSDGEEDERELKFTLLSGSSGDSPTDRNDSLSPSDDLFFKGRFVPVDQISETNSKTPQLRVSLMKSATKFRVMMLKFKKSKSDAESFESTESNAPVSSKSKEQKNEQDSEENEQKKENQVIGKSTPMKFKVEEVPAVSLFTRDNSSKAPKKGQNHEKSVSISSDEKKFSKEAMQRYLRKVKPLYVRVSKRYGEKLKFSGQMSLAGAIKANVAAPQPSADLKPYPAVKPKTENESTEEFPEPPLLTSHAKGLKQGNLPAGLRVVCKHLGKSRSASTAVAASPPGAMPSKRRDDSLLEQQDGIQSAILHCKRSFKASRDFDSSSLLTSTNSSPISPSSDAAAAKVTAKINKTC